MIKQQDFKIVILTIAIRLDKCNWTIIKQIIYEEFSILYKYTCVIKIIIISQISEKQKNIMKY
jgi:hypothetical protein